MKSRFKTLDEFYKAMDSLIDILIANKHADDAAKLNDLLHHTAWTIGSELLGEVQLALKDMKGKYPRDLAEEINECCVFSVNHR